MSFTASLYYFIVGMCKPEILNVYSKANIPSWGIRSWAVIVGIGGLLILFPQTFKSGGVLMILNSLFTIGCFVVIKNIWGGFFELLFLQIPVYLLWNGYPIVDFGKHLVK